MTDDSRLSAWLEALEARHLADLTPSEAARALRALSSCYVQRRAKLSQGGALDSAGKRAAFALFYAPVHYLVVREILGASGLASMPITSIVDLGCGTGTAGAAWAIEAGGARVSGVDRHPWAAAEANWTYRNLGLHGRARTGDLARTRLPREAGAGILAAYAVNELDARTRDSLLQSLLEAARAGTRVFIVEPISRRVADWWPSWEQTMIDAGGRSDEWRFAAPLPARQRELARAAGLDPRELTARSLWL